PVPDSPAGVAHEDARVDFDHPPGEVATEAFGGSDEHDDGHDSPASVVGVSNSGPITEMWVWSMLGSITGKSKSSDQFTPPGTGFPRSSQSRFTSGSGRSTPSGASSVLTSLMMRGSRPVPAIRSRSAVRASRSSRRPRAASWKASGMVYSALYRSAMSITKEVAEPVWMNPRPGLAPSPTMTAWQMP